MIWGPALVTGVEEIDQQHKVLVDMCNEAYQLVQANATADSAKKLLRDLTSYALYHFEAEEEIALQCGYAEDQADQNAQHRAQHRAFATTVAEMQVELFRGNGVSMDQLFAFLRAWLTDHILGTDMQLAAYIRAKA
jgi:hemerythrin